MPGRTAWLALLLAGAAAHAETVFVGMGTPRSAAEIASAYSAARVRGPAGREVALEYRTLFTNLDRVGSNPHPAGALYDAAGNVLRDPDGAPVVAETPDANSLLAVAGAGVTPDGSRRLYLVTHFEYDWLLADRTQVWRRLGWHRRMPMAMALTTVVQAPGDGRLSAIDQRNIDFSTVGGLWIPCAGSQTPWGTHLGSEEDYELYRLDAVRGGLAAMSALYLGGAPANPYRYGYHVEVTVAADGATSVAKHYSMGRASWEKARVMPDRRTVYMGDDGAYTGLFMYVADRPGALDAGTLYAGRWEQASAADGGDAALTWIRLGHATDRELDRVIERQRFGNGESTVFEFAARQRPGFRAIHAGQRRRIEYLRLRPGMAPAAAFLESRRYAAWRGATTEFHKMEGVALDADGRTLYLAMSRIGGGMRAERGEPADHVRVARLAAGGVYALTLSVAARDADGQPIASEWVASRMRGVPALRGVDLATADRHGNRAAVDRVANPDNLAFSAALRTLFIGEDSDLHTNNFVWAFEVDSGHLARIASMPAGAEATGLQAVDDIDGHRYLMLNYQHAGERISIPDADLRAAVERRIDPLRAGIGDIQLR